MYLPKLVFRDFWLFIFGTLVFPPQLCAHPLRTCTTMGKAEAFPKAPAAVTPPPANELNRVRAALPPHLRTHRTPSNLYVPRVDPSNHSTTATFFRVADRRALPTTMCQPNTPPHTTSTPPPPVSAGARRAARHRGQHRARGGGRAARADGRARRVRALDGRGLAPFHHRVIVVQHKTRLL
jgi:hypothetical protein